MMSTESTESTVSTKAPVTPLGEDLAPGDRAEAARVAEAAVAEAAQLVLHEPAVAPDETARTPPDHERLARAFAFAAERHKTQTRKSTPVPYVTHLMAVSSLVGEHGGGEDEMIAALLHDCVEDQGVSVAEVEERFGARVAEIVAGCTDGDPGRDRHQQSWLERKTGYLRRLVREPLYILRVSASDKLHNLRTILDDLRADPIEQAVFTRFRAGRTGTLWYYRALADVFAALAVTDEADEGFRRLAAALEYGVEQLEHLSGSPR